MYRANHTCWCNWSDQWNHFNAHSFALTSINQLSRMGQNRQTPCGIFKENILLEPVESWKEVWWEISPKLTLTEPLTLSNAINIISFESISSPIYSMRYPYVFHWIHWSIALTLSDKKVKTLSLPKLCPLNLRLLEVQKGLKRRKTYQACNGHMLSTQPIREPRPNPSTSLISKSNNNTNEWQVHPFNFISKLHA